MKLIFFGKVVDGRLKIIRESDFNEAVRSFDGKEVQLVIEKKKKALSLLQNNYWWGVVIPMVQQGFLDTGWKLSKLETHEELLRFFSFDEKVNENTGEVRRFRKGSSELSTSAFMDLIAEVQQFASEYLSINIPEPGEQLTFEL